jgi:hypothetical protein
MLLMGQRQVNENIRLAESVLILLHVWYNTRRR